MKNRLDSQKMTQNVIDKHFTSRSYVDLKDKSNKHFQNLRNLQEPEIFDVIIDNAGSMSKEQETDPYVYTVDSKT